MLLICKYKSILHLTSLLPINGNFFTALGVDSARRIKRTKKATKIFIPKFVKTCNTNHANIKNILFFKIILEPQKSNNLLGCPESLIEDFNEFFWYE